MLYRLRTVAKLLTWEARLFWLAFGVPIALLLLTGLISCYSTDRWQYLGLLLQMGGIALVAYGIMETRKQFDAPDRQTGIVKWLRNVLRAVVGPRPFTTGIGSLSVGPISGGSGYASGVLSFADPSLEGRVTALEEVIRQMKQQLADVRQDLSDSKDSQSKALADEIAARSAQVADARELLKDLAVGGLHLEAVGLIWLLFATVAGSIPGDLPWISSLWPCW